MQTNSCKSRGEQFFGPVGSPEKLTFGPNMSLLRVFFHVYMGKKDMYLF